MAMKRCKEDMHFYDVDKHKECPYCRGIDEEVDETEAHIGETAGFPTNGRDEAGKTAGKHHEYQNSDPTIGEYDPNNLERETIGIYDTTKFETPKEEKFEPVVGWLVCTEGPNRGRDYRICAKSGSNIISRTPGKNISIVISGDDSISRSEHAEILFDKRDNVFYLVRKASSEVRLSNKLVLSSELLKAYDEIELGTSKFRFVPFCVGDVIW